MKLLQELYYLTESKMVNALALNEMSTQDVLEEIADIMSELEQKYKSNETSSQTVKSAPDTSKFVEVKSGIIKLEKNVSTHSHYGGTTQWKVFLKIGGAVEPSIRKKIMSDFRNELSKLIDRPAGEESTVIYCDDAKVIVGTADGTSWGGVGAYKHRLESSWKPEAKK